MQNAIARANIYALLSRILLQELDEQTLQAIKDDEQIMEFFPTFKEWNILSSTPNSKLLEEYLNPDFVNIAILHLIPYETFYTRDDQQIETGGANPATDMYSAFDFVVDFEAARCVSADHIGVELEFMHHLTKAEIKALEDEDSESVEHLRATQKEFLNKHLLKWAPMYLINAKYESRTPLYYDACDMTLEFLLSDNEYLSDYVSQ